MLRHRGGCCVLSARDASKEHGGQEGSGQKNATGFRPDPRCKRHTILAAGACDRQGEGDKDQRQIERRGSGGFGWGWDERSEEPER